MFFDMSGYFKVQENSVDDSALCKNSVKDKHQPNTCL